MNELSTERLLLRPLVESDVEALHLLDIVLPEHRKVPGAIAAAIAAHEGLLQDSDNFWLSSWLEHQIKQLEMDKP